MTGANGSAVLSPDFVALLRQSDRQQEPTRSAAAERDASSPGGLDASGVAARDASAEALDDPSTSRPARRVAPDVERDGFLPWLRSHWARLAAGAALAAVAAVAGVISFDHVETLTLALHQRLVVARLMPFGVDGLIVVGSIVLLTAVPGTEWLGWLGVVPGVGASLFANVESGLAYGWLAATWAGVPAGSFALACFLLERWLKAQASAGAAGQQDGPDAVWATVPNCAEAAALASYRATLTAGNPWSGRQLETRFGLTRAQASKVRELAGAVDGGDPDA